MIFPFDKTLICKDTNVLYLLIIICVFTLCVLLFLNRKFKKKKEKQVVLNLTHFNYYEAAFIFVSFIISCLVLEFSYRTERSGNTGNTVFSHQDEERPQVAVPYSKIAGTLNGMILGLN